VISSKPFKKQILFSTALFPSGNQLIQQKSFCTQTELTQFEEQKEIFKIRKILLAKQTLNFEIEKANFEIEKANLKNTKTKFKQDNCKKISRKIKLTKKL